MAKWISRALAFVKVFAARLECPFAKSSAGCSQAGSQSVIQTAPAASLPVCVSLKSIKMLQIKLKVSTFFPPPSLFHIRLVLQPRLGSGLGLGFGFGCGFRFRWGLASASFACATFSNDNYKSFCCTLLSSTFASFPLAGNYFLISSLIVGVARPFLSISLSVARSQIVCNCR